MCHESGVRHHFLPPLLAAALAVGGCASPSQQSAKAMAKMEREQKQQSSRAVEERRMHALDYGDVASKRGAEVLVVDPTKTFDPTRSGVGTARTVSTGGARTKDFNFDQKARPGNFLTRAFSSSKADAAAERKFVTGEAGTRNYNTGEARDSTKSAATRKLWDGSKVAATRDSSDAAKPFLGPESSKLRKAVDPKTMADWRSAGAEAVSYTDHSVERSSTFKPLTIDDVRDLLNKNK
jgi:type II secretory pathway pseudopilin PulG